MSKNRHRDQNQHCPVSNKNSIIINGIQYRSMEVKKLWDKYCTSAPRQHMRLEKR